MQVRGSSGRTTRRVLGILLLASCVVGVGYPVWWNHRSEVVGSELVAKAAVARSSGGSCPTTAPTAAVPAGGPGVLEIPSVGLVAPVLDGLTDQVLNVAVGHPSGTLWPGAPGEALLEAHDVSYFANLGKVAKGAEVIWVTRCMRAEFYVTGTAISHPGATLPTPSGGTGLALVTCYPTNALFWTNDRFVVTTSLVRESIGRQSQPAVPSNGTKLVVPAPPSLVATGLGLDQPGNSIVLHTLKFAGSPSPAWVQGPGPLQVEADALSVLFGAAKAVGANNSQWWKAITVPGVARPSHWPLTGSTVDVTITIDGSSPQRVTIASAYETAVLSIANRTIRLASLS